MMRQVFARLKQVVGRYQGLIFLAILGLALAFLAKALYEHWQAIRDTPITPVGWSGLAIATGLTLLSHIWTGWVWGWILEDLGQSVSKVWAVHTYLTTNIAKYIPSNVVHLLGRTKAATDIGVPLGPASLSVVLDTLLMASAGLMMGLLSIPPAHRLWSIVGLIGVLVLVHPRVLRRFTKLVPRGKQAREAEEQGAFELQHYPVKPLLGEMGFIVLRSLGFVVTLGALMPLDPWSIPRYMSIYSIGWLLGFIIPGVPGGIGVLELTATALLSQPGVLSGPQVIPIGKALVAVGIHRLINTLAEALGAGLATLDIRFPNLGRRVSGS